MPEIGFLIRRYLDAKNQRLYHKQLGSEEAKQLSETVTPDSDPESILFRKRF